MFGKLKDIAGSGALQKLIDKVGPEIKLKLQECLATVDSGIISDDASYGQNVIGPVKLAVEASASGATKLVPHFDDKFDIAMLHLRDELIVTQGAGVALVEDFDQRLPDVLKSGFEKTREIA